MAVQSDFQANKSVWKRRSWRWWWLDDSGDKYAAWARMWPWSEAHYRPVRGWQRYMYVSVMETERLRDGWKWSVHSSIMVVHHFWCERPSGGSLGVKALNLGGGNDTMSMAEWVSSEVISAEVRLVLLLIIITALQSPSRVVFCHRNLRVWNYFHPDMRTICEDASDSPSPFL